MKQNIMKNSYAINDFDDMDIYQLFLLSITIK